jgi:hypothetical protein
VQTTSPWARCTFPKAPSTRQPGDRRINFKSQQGSDRLRSLKLRKVNGLLQEVAGAAQRSDSMSLVAGNDLRSTAKVERGSSRPESRPPEDCKPGMCGDVKSPLRGSVRIFQQSARSTAHGRRATRFESRVRADGVKSREGNLPKSEKTSHVGKSC